MPESLKKLPPKECLPKMISYLAHKYPEKPHDQIVAISASECGVSRKDTYGMDYGIQAAMWLSHYKEKYPYLNVKDQLRHAYQAIKKQTDFYNSFEEKSLEHVLLQVAEDFEENKKIKDAYEAISDACSLLPHDIKLKIASNWYDFRTSEIGKDFSCDLFYEFVAYQIRNFIEDFVVAEVQTTDFEIECSEQEFFDNRINQYIDVMVYDSAIKNERNDKLIKALDTITEDATTTSKKIKWITIKGRHIPLKKGQKIVFEKDGSYKTVSEKEYAERKEQKIQKTIEKKGYERERAEKEVKEKRQKRKKEVGYEKENLNKEKIEKKQKQIQNHINKFQELNKKHKSSALTEFITLATELLAESMKKNSDLRSPLKNALTRLRKRIKTEKLTDQQKTAILHQIESLAKEVKELSKEDFLTEDMKLNLNPSELRLILEMLKNVDIDDRYYATLASNIAHKINMKSTGKFKEVENEAIDVGIERELHNLKNTLYSFYDVYSDIANLDPSEQEMFSQEVDGLAENVGFDSIIDAIHNWLEKNPYYETKFKTEKEAEEWHNKFNKFIEKGNLNGFIDFLTEQVIEIGKANSENKDWEESVKEEFGASKIPEIRKGKGWFGESDRHSKARKEGHADLITEDSMSELVQWVLAKKLTTDPKEAQEIAFAIANSNKKKKQKVESQVSTLKEQGESYKKSQESEWESTWSEIGESFTKQREARKKYKEYKKNNQDLTTEDATHLQQYASTIAQIEKARQSPEAKALLEAFGKEAFKTEIESITVPFTTMNTETGTVIQGSVVENLQENTKQLTPVSSSTVRGVGQFDNELLVQFHPGKNTPQRTYRYQFEDASGAEEAYRSLTESGSPGRWIWQNVRGHTKGEPVTSNKLGPSYHTGTPTIGGTTASLVEYEVSNRVPVQRTAGFEQQSRQLKRETSNPTNDPQTGSRVEALLGVRKILREGLPEPTQLRKKDFGTIFTADFTMDGIITRSGEFDYRPEGQGIKIKNYDNLKEEFKKITHLPVFGKRTIGSHKESSNSLIGFAHNWQFIDPNVMDSQGHVKADVELFYDIHDLSGLDNPNELPVSIGFDDLGDGSYQHISRLHHLAVSLDKLEKDRCSSLGGTPCNISVKKRITDFIKSKFTKKGVDSDSDDLLANRTESFYDTTQKESCPPIKKQNKKVKSMGLINKKITEDIKTKTEEEEVPEEEEESEDEEDTKPIPKKKKGKDMIDIPAIEDLIKKSVETSITKAIEPINVKLQGLESEAKKREDLQKTLDDKEASDLRNNLQKEPYGLPEPLVKDMTLIDLKKQKNIFDNTQRVKDFFANEQQEKPSIDKELFDMTPIGKMDSLQKVIDAAQAKYGFDFSKKEAKN